MKNLILMPFALFYMLSPTGSRKADSVSIPIESSKEEAPISDKSRSFTQFKTCDNSVYQEYQGNLEDNTEAIANNLVDSLDIEKNTTIAKIQPLIIKHISLKKGLFNEWGHLNK